MQTKYNFDSNRDGLPLKERDAFITHLDGLEPLLSKYQVELAELYPSAIFDVALMRDGPPLPGKFAPMEVVFDIDRDYASYEIEFNSDIEAYQKSVQDSRLNALADKLMTDVENIGHAGYILTDIYY